MTTVFLYVPSGETSPYQLGRRLYSAAYWDETDGFEIIPITDSTNVGDLPLAHDAIFHLTVTPWISCRPYWRWIRYFRKKGIKIITNNHGDFRIETVTALLDRDFGSALKQSPSAILSKVILQNSDYHIVNSSLIKNRMVDEYDIDQHTIFVIPNGLNQMGVADIPPDEHWGVSGRPLTIITHGALTHQKGLVDLIGAFSSLPRGKYRLQIIGAGSAENLLRHQILDAGLEKEIGLLGAIPHPNLFKVISGADIGVYPSHFDGFNIAALESLKCCRGPVLLSERIGLCDYLSDALKNNIFVPSPSMIAQKILEFSKMGRGDICNVVTEQRSIADRLTWKNIWPQYIQAYRDVLEKESNLKTHL